MSHFQVARFVIISDIYGKSLSMNKLLLVPERNAEFASNNLPKLVSSACGMVLILMVLLIEPISSSTMANSYHQQPSLTNAIAIKSQASNSSPLSHHSNQLIWNNLGLVRTKRQIGMGRYNGRGRVVRPMVWRQGRPAQPQPQPQPQAQAQPAKARATTTKKPNKKKVVKKKKPNVKPAGTTAAPASETETPAAATKAPAPETEAPVAETTAEPTEAPATEPAAEPEPEPEPEPEEEPEPEPEEEKAETPRDRAKWYRVSFNGY